MIQQNWGDNPPSNLPSLSLLQRLCLRQVSRGRCHHLSSLQRTPKVSLGNLYFLLDITCSEKFLVTKICPGRTVPSEEWQDFNKLIGFDFAAKCGRLWDKLLGIMRPFFCNSWQMKPINPNLRPREIGNGCLCEFPPDELDFRRLSATCAQLTDPRWWNHKVSHPDKSLLIATNSTNSTNTQNWGKLNFTSVRSLELRSIPG